MLTTGLLVAAMLGAALALVVAAATVLSGLGSPAAPRPVTARQARLVCPELGNLKRVLLDADGGPVRVIRCDRFGHGPVTCEQRCLMAVG